MSERKIPENLLKIFENQIKNLIFNQRSNRDGSFGNLEKNWPRSVFRAGQTGGRLSCRLHRNYDSKEEIESVP